MSRLSLLAKIASVSRTDGGGVGIEDRRLDAPTTAALLTLIERDFVKSEPAGLGWTFYQVTRKGMLALKAISPDPLSACIVPQSMPSGERALWSWLLEHGGEVSAYGVRPEATPEVWHLVTCGLDASKSGSVRDDVWTIFAGTFADDERRSGVSGRAWCQCGQVADLALVAEVESVTSLLRQVLAR